MKLIDGIMEKENMINDLMDRLEQATDRYIEAESFIMSLNWYERLFCSRKINKFLKSRVNK